MRKRINLSVNEYTYNELSDIAKQLRIKNVCVLLIALANIIIDRHKAVEQRRYEMPQDDETFIDEMFKNLSSVMPTPDGTIPVRHNNKTMR